MYFHKSRFSRTKWWFHHYVTFALPRLIKYLYGVLQLYKKDNHCFHCHLRKKTKFPKRILHTKNLNTPHRPPRSSTILTPVPTVALHFRRPLSTRANLPPCLRAQTVHPIPMAATVRHPLNTCPSVRGLQFSRGVARKRGERGCAGDE